MIADTSPDPDLAPAGHRRTDLADSFTIDAWGPDRATCLVEAARALADEVAVAPDSPVVQVLPVVAGSGAAADALAGLLQQVIDALQVLSVVPVRIHLEETEDGALAGDMEVARVMQVRPGGRLPRALSWHELSMEPSGGGWRCHVTIDVEPAVG